MKQQRFFVVLLAAAMSVAAWAQGSSNIAFVDPEVKRICVQNWDTNGDGQLSKAEAAAVKDIGKTFQSSKIMYFDEFQYFTGVKQIGYESFLYCYDLVSIVLPNGLETLGRNAFIDCSSLASISLPPSLKEICIAGFWACSSLTSLTIPKSVTSIAEPIAGYQGGLAGNSGVISIKVEEGNPVYDSRNDCNAIIETSSNKLIVGCKSTTIPNSVKTIGCYAFECCIGLTEINIPTSVKTIEYSAFHRCSDLVKIHIPSSVTSIGHEAYQECNAIKQVSVDPSNPVFDSRDNCNAIINTASNELMIGFNVSTIPNTVKSIGDGAFDYCSGITSITIPNSVNYIGYSAFRYCKNLTSITIPKSVTYIMNWAFVGCESLEKVISMIDNPFVIDESAFWKTYDQDFTTATLYVPKGTKAKYQTTNGWKKFKNIVEGGSSTPTKDLIAFENPNPEVKRICVANWDTNGDGELSKAEAAAVKDLGEVFKNSRIRSFNELQYFTGLSSIGIQAFYGSIYLSSITIPNSVKSIGEYAFAGCSNLFSIAIPNTVTSIGDDAFFDCRRLASIVVENGNRYYDSRNNCNAIIETSTNILMAGCQNTIIPNTVTEIGHNAFSRRIGLTSITIPNSVKKIRYQAFYNCFGLKSITIPNSVAVIEFDAFKNCSGLASIKVESGNHYYDSRESCNAIIETSTNTLIAGCRNTIIPNSVTSIGEGAFYGCIGRTSITIPNSVTSIGDGAFYGCRGLTSITIPNSVTSIGHTAFSYCSSLTSVYSNIKDVFAIKDNVFGLNNVTFTTATLYVPYGTKAKYQATDGWKKFKNIVEMEPEKDYVILTAKSYTREYGEANPTFGYEVTSGTITSGQPTLSCAATKTSPVGTYDIIIQKGTVSNGTVNLVKGTLTITKAPLTIKAGSYTKEEGQDNPEFTLTYTGFKNGETKSVLTKQPTVSCNATTNSPAGTYTVTVSGAEAQNYEICYVSGTLTITPKPVVVNNIAFTDPEVKRICVANWDTNGDGELSKAEAAAVTDLGGVFKNNNIIKSFNELQYFTGLTSIGENAFYYCGGLSSIIIPNSVTDIGRFAFAYCSCLTSIIIPNSVINIGGVAFYYCTGLTSVTISNSVTTIGDRVFQGCSGLTSITIPNSVTSIGEYTFGSCTGLTSIIIPNSVTSIGNSAFHNCTGLTNITIPNSVTTIGIGAFGGCTKLTYITIPNSVTKIESYSFSGCSGLTSIIIPNSVTDIGYRAFWECTGLTSVTIPNSVTNIGRSTFEGCTSIKELYSLIEQPFAIDWSVFGDLFTTATLYVPAGTKAKYQTTDGWKNFMNIVEEGSSTPVEDNITFADPEVKRICVANWDTNGDGELSKAEAAAVQNLGEVFKENTTIKSFDELKYFTGLLSIGKQAFDRCSSLTSITIPSSTTSIGEYAFYACTGLTLITIPKFVSNIELYAFGFCSGLTSITIPSSVKSIGYHAFVSCSSLTSIKVEDGNKDYDSRNNCNAIIETSTNTLIAGCRNTIIPNSVTSIGEDAFHGCSSLTSIPIPNSVTSIGDAAFYGCTGLTNITIPNSVTSIGVSAFWGCSGLTNITIPNSVTSIGEDVFSGCTGLTSFVVEEGNRRYDSRDNCNAIIETITNTLIAGCQRTAIPNSVTSIGDWAFSICRGMTSITIPNSVTSIGNFAFLACSGLTSIIIPNSVTSIGVKVFWYCTDLTSITIPNSVTSIGSSAFYGCSNLQEVHSLKERPFAINEDVFQNGDGTFTSATLYVPYGTKAKYQATDGWKNFKNIVEMEPEKDDVTLTAKSYTREYGEANPTFGYEVTSGTITSGQPTLSCAATKTSPVGTYDIIIQKGSVSNGTVNLIKGTLTITKAPLTIKAGSYTKEEGQDNPEFTLTYTGFKNGETKSVLTKQPTVSCNATTNSPAGTYTVTVSGAEARNYQISYVSGTLTVTPKPAVINNIVFDDPEVKRICVANWDTNGDGELSEAEAAAVTNIGTAFKNNTKIWSFNELQYFTGLRSIGDYAFQGCSALTAITIPSSVESIGTGAFAGCSGLLSIVVDSNNRYYDSRNKCNAIIETSTNTLIVGCRNTAIPSTVTSIGTRAFYGCTELTFITIPNSVRMIGSEAFGACTKLSSITIPNSVESIGTGAFMECAGLTFITIPNSVTSIGVYAFFGCTSLTSVFSSIENVFAIEDNVFWINDNRVFTSATLYVPKGTKAVYQVTDGWKNFMNIVQEGGDPDDVTLTAKSYTREYGEANPTFGYEVTSGTITSGQPTLSCSATRTSPVGTYDIVIQAGTVSNGTVNLVKGTLTITKAPLTISAGSYTKEEGQDNPEFTLTYTGFKNNETKSVLTKQPTVSCIATKDSPAGTYTVNISGAESQNYEISYVSGTLTITPKPVVEQMLVEYFLDNDPGFGNATPVAGAEWGTKDYALDIRGASAGAHILYIRCKDENGRWSATISRPLYVCQTLDVTAVEYYFDNADPGEGLAMPVPMNTLEGDEMTFDVPIDGLTLGRHYLKVRARDSKGRWSLVSSESFLIVQKETGVREAVADFAFSIEAHSSRCLITPHDGTQRNDCRVEVYDISGHRLASTLWPQTEPQLSLSVSTRSGDILIVKILDTQDNRQLTRRVITK